MEPEARYKLIGVTVIALLAAVALVFVWLSRAGVAAEFRFYTIHFERQSLEGLQVGGDVNMQGIKVGRVEAFSIDRDNINRVNVVARVARRTPVSTNTTAVIARNLVTGIARINLETPGTPGPELEAVPEGESYPVIAEGTSDMEQIAESANRLVLSGEQALENLNRLMADDNQRALGETLAAARDLAVGLNARLATLDGTLRNVDASAQAFMQTSRQVGALAESAGGLVQESKATLAELRGVAGSGRAALDESRGTLAEFARLARTLERQSADLVPRVTDMADIGLLELRATAQETRRAAEALSLALERLSEPRSALIGPSAGELGPGERAP